MFITGITNAKRGFVLDYIVVEKDGELTKVEWDKSHLLRIGPFFLFLCNILTFNSSYVFSFKKIRGGELKEAELWLNEKRPQNEEQNILKTVFVSGVKKSDNFNVRKKWKGEEKWRSTNTA